MFKLLTLLAWSFYTSVSMSALAEFKAQNVSGSYEQSLGRMHLPLGQFKYSIISAALNDVSSDFKRVQEGLWVEYAGTRILLKTDLSFLNILQSFSFQDANLSFENSRLDFYTPLIDARLEPRNFELRNLSLSSDISDYDQSAQDFNVLEAILLNTDLAIKSLKLDPFMLSQIKGDFLRENPGDEDAARETETFFASASFLPVTVKNIRLVLKKETFSGSMLIDSWLSANLHVGGNLELDKANKRLIVSLHKARLGYFSILRIALRVIRALDLEDVSVQGNKLIIDFSSDTNSLESVRGLLSSKL